MENEREREEILVPFEKKHSVHTYTEYIQIRNSLADYITQNFVRREKLVSAYKETRRFQNSHIKKDQKCLQLQVELEQCKKEIQILRTEKLSRDALIDELQQQLEEEHKANKGE